MFQNIREDNEVVPRFIGTRTCKVVLQFTGKNRAIERGSGLPGHRVRFDCVDHDALVQRGKKTRENAIARPDIKNTCAGRNDFNDFVEGISHIGKYPADSSGIKIEGFGWALEQAPHGNTRLSLASK